MFPGANANQLGLASGTKIQNVFSVTADTAANLDALSTTGWDLLIGKSRANATSWTWRDSARGISNTLASDTTAAEAAFTSYASNLSAGNAVLTRAKKAPKFFDVVTYTGNGVAGRTIAHSLGVAPGMVIVKRRDAAGYWIAQHISTGNAYLQLNQTAAAIPDNGFLWGNGSSYVAPTSTTFTVSSYADVNASGGTYVAYLFAHDTSANGLVQCGSATSGVAVNLGWEPGFVIAKLSGAASSWLMTDSTRGMSTAVDPWLAPNSSGAESTANVVDVTPTGMTFDTTTWGAGAPMIYLAIRKGPM